MAELGMLHHLARFARLEPSLRKAVLRAALELLAIEALLRTTSLARTCRILGIEVGASTRRAIPASSAYRERASVAEALLELSTDDQRALAKVARSWPFGGSCLRYSLALGWRLRHQRPTLGLGVRTDPGAQLNAHAWLELGALRIDFAGEHDATPRGGFVPLKAAPTDAT